jgi:hypothetical protein
MKPVFRIIKIALIFSLFLYLLTGSVITFRSPVDRVGVFTNLIAFDYISWTVRAVWDKLALSSLGISRYLTHAQRRMILKEYLYVISEGEALRADIEAIYANPTVGDPEEETGDLRQQLANIEDREIELSLLTETVVQDQVSEIIFASGLASLTQPFPPVLYRISDLPKNLILSPRDEIQQEASISLRANLNVQQIKELEEKVEEETGFSALVVPVGGVGSYPSMVIRTQNLPYLFETVAHEWTHNYLTLRPLGIRYNVSTELRTMNETTASIAGKEFSRMLIEIYFPVPSRQQPSPYRNLPASFGPLEKGNKQEVTTFNYRQEMYNTRLHTEALLENGQIEKAEDYMESRRKVFWENGYQIRRLNQAYFAFYGAYADQTYSAAGADPVGESVRILWDRSRSLENFIRAMSKLKNYNELRILVESF